MKLQHLVVTGGEGALAKAIASEFDRPDWRVSNPGRGELDVEDCVSIESFFKAQHVDLLVCAAGIIRDAPLARLTDDDWEKTLAVNFTGAARCARAVLSGMIERQRGQIIFISSQSALHPPAGQAAYASAKAALLGLTRDLATAHGIHGIRVNAILPGFLETPMTAAVHERRLAQVQAEHVLGTFNTCGNVASFIRHLHERLPCTSGQVFQLDSRPGT